MYAWRTVKALDDTVAKAALGTLQVDSSLLKGEVCSPTTTSNKRANSRCTHCAWPALAFSPV